jgi:hypothetical protein
MPVAGIGGSFGRIPPRRPAKEMVRLISVPCHLLLAT